MAEMLEHMSEYLYDFTEFIFASIRCTIPNFQTCERFCCSLYPPPFPAGQPRYIYPPSQWVGQDISYAFRMGWPGYIYPPSQQIGQDISTPLPSGSARIYLPPFPADWPRYTYPHPFPVGQPG